MWDAKPFIGMLSHLERDCVIVDARPDKEIDGSYMTRLWAPVRNVKNNNMGARWLRNSSDQGKTCKKREI